MSRNMEWIADNLSLGGLLRNSVSAVGTVSGWGIRGAGYAAERMSNGSGRGTEIRESYNQAAISVDNGITKGGQVLGRGVNKGVDVVGAVTGKACGGVARMVGVDEDRAAKITTVGDLVGRVAVGAVVGMGVGHIATVAAAASGASGAAATASGLAALGGGSVAAGGGGMAAGQAVVQTIVAAGAASAAVTAGEDDPERAQHCE